MDLDMPLLCFDYSEAWMEGDDADAGFSKSI